MITKEDFKNEYFKSIIKNYSKQPFLKFVNLIINNKNFDSVNFLSNKMQIYTGEYYMEVLYTNIEIGSSPFILALIDIINKYPNKLELLKRTNSDRNLSDCDVEVWRFLLKINEEVASKIIKAINCLEDTVTEGKYLNTIFTFIYTYKYFKHYEITFYLHLNEHIVEDLKWFDLAYKSALSLKMIEELQK